MTQLLQGPLNDNLALTSTKHRPSTSTRWLRRYVVVATKPVHRLQIRPTVHN